MQKRNLFLRISIVEIVCKIAYEKLLFLYDFNSLVSILIDEKSISDADSMQILTLKQLQRLFIKINHLETYIIS